MGLCGSLAQFRDSDLAKSIAQAYQVSKPPQVEARTVEPRHAPLIDDEEAKTALSKVF